MNITKNKTPFIKPELSVEELSIALYEANQKLTESNRQLKESEHIRTEMFSNISHDLRSPIATIRSYVEYMLSFDFLDKEDVFYNLNLINSKILLLDHLINDLLFITTLDSAPEDMFHYESVQIGIFLEDFFYSCEADKKYEDRHLILKVPTNFPFIATIDTKMLYRVLDNLFSNALKYSSSGDSITLDAYLLQQEILIAITDTGIGIAPSNLTKIFNRTFMVSNARTPHRSNGFGLGLSIAKSIISKHRGRIWCSSCLGKGSTFHIALPHIVTCLLFYIFQSIICQI